MIAIVLAVLFAGVEGEPVHIAAPVDVWAASSVAHDWGRFDSLPAMSGHGSLVVSLAAKPPAGASRVDIFERRDGRWTWIAAAKPGDGFSLDRSEQRRAVLVRFEASRFYFWGEAASNSTRAVSLKEYKTIALAHPVESAALLIEFEDTPRVASGDRFLGVPVEAAIVCSVGSSGDRCAAVPAAVTDVNLDVAATAAFRALRVDEQAEDRFRILAKGNTKVRPRDVEARVLRAGAWVALAPADKRVSWEDVVIDRSGGDFALERIMGRSLPVLPAATHVQMRREHGVVVRPWIGDKQPLTDSHALLVVLADTKIEPSAQIPLAITAPNDRGEFELPELASDTYVLQLLSSESSSDRVSTALSTNVPVDVNFRSGPTVRGRLLRTSGGSATTAAVVEVGPLQTAKEAMHGDLVERMRFATADENGRFHVVIAAPGMYRIRATWGTASAERDFAIEAKDVDLGEISLTGGASLHGSIAECREGEAALIAVPDFSKPVTVGFGDVRRTPIDASGRFIAEGLSPGKWSVVFRCSGALVSTVPEVVAVPPSGDVIMEFTRAVAP